MRRAATLLAALLVFAIATGAKKPKAPKVPPRPAAVDSVTTALWTFDENGGPNVGDAGPFRLRGTAGPDARTDFGRFGSARLFTRTLQSFAVVPYSEALETPRGFTFEAWVQPNSASAAEVQLIAARWSPAPGQQSWMFGVVGNKQTYPFVAAGQSPLFTNFFTDLATGHLAFVMQPAEAAAPLSFGSLLPLPLGRWSHVAVTVDGATVKLWIDGRLDSQFASPYTIRPSHAPLVFGAFLDERRLTDVSGTLQLEGATDYSPFYSFDGAIDDARLSNAARANFEALDQR